MWLVKLAVSWRFDHFFNESVPDHAISDNDYILLAHRDIGLKRVSIGFFDCSLGRILLDSVFPAILEGSREDRVLIGERLRAHPRPSCQLTSLSQNLLPKT